MYVECVPLRVYAWLSISLFCVCAECQTHGLRLCACGYAMRLVKAMNECDGNIKIYCFHIFKGYVFVWQNNMHFQLFKLHSALEPLELWVYE